MVVAVVVLVVLVDVVVVVAVDVVPVVIVDAVVVVSTMHRTRFWRNQSPVKNSVLLVLSCGSASF